MSNERPQYTQEAMNEAQQEMRQILARSTTDLDFREQLLSNPRKAIAEHTGQDLSDLPETFELVFVENEADATIVLPDVVSYDDELSEDELQAVAGGEVAVLGTIALTLATVAATLYSYDEIVEQD